MKVAKLLASLREVRDALEFRWTKRTYRRCYPFEDGSGYMCGYEVESVEPKRWQKFTLRLFVGFRAGAEGRKPGNILTDKSAQKIFGY
jgi:hypothetical protein